jgi:thiol-disulfide isomerase/thioredoxin
MSADETFVQCLEGKGELALESIEGPALISAWASWCSNCESQRPYLIELYQKAKGKIQVVGVDVEEKSKSEGFEHALKKGISYPQLYDPDGRTSNAFGPGVPITQFKDAKNRVVFQQIGPFKSYEEIQTLVAKYLGVEIG